MPIGYRFTLSASAIYITLMPTCYCSVVLTNTSFALVSADVVCFNLFIYFVTLSAANIKLKKLHIFS